MKQLRNYRQGNDSSRNGNNSYGGKTQNTMQPNTPDFGEAVKKYEGMEEDELINQLLNSVRTQRANGTYNPVQMNSYVQMLKPHLSPAQCEKLQNIINIINSENV